MIKPDLEKETLMEEVWDVFGERIVRLVGGEQTFYRFSVVEETSPAGSAVPPHFHNQTDEVIYVLEGEYEFEIGGQRRWARKGDVVVIPRRTPHSFRNPLDTPSKMLAIITPSGFENFFAEVNGLKSADLLKVVEIGKRNDLELVV